jgi:hypothetical protein
VLLPVASAVIPGVGVVSNALGLTGGGRSLARTTFPERGLGGVSVGGPSGFVLQLPSFGGGGSAPSGQAGQWPTNKDGTPRRQRKDGKPYKRPAMNVGNARAARRSINRIRGVRKLLKSIEMTLPKRSVRTSHGVITRGEAARALRT